MEVSLVIRTLNEEKNIGECLTHVLNQSLRPAEVIIVDNESSDRTRAIAMEFLGKLPIKIVNNPVRGFSSGLNKGAQEAKCGLIAFLSADCYPDINWLKELINVMSKNGCAIVQGHEVPPDNNDVHYVLRNEVKAPKSDARIAYFTNTNVLFERKALELLLPFRGVGKLQGSEDTVASLKLKSKNLVAMIASQATVHHNMFSTSKEFKNRVKYRGHMSVYLFLAHPLHPRVYLNIFFWATREFLLGVLKWDLRFVKVAVWRFAAAVQGIIIGITNLDNR